MPNSLGDTYEDFVQKRQEYFESERADSRIELAGYFYEIGWPLTDEVLATMEYQRRKSLGLMDLSNDPAVLKFLGKT